MNNTTNSNLFQGNTVDETRWQCYGRFQAELEDDILFYGNNIALTVVSGPGILISLLLNSLILYILHKDLEVRSPSTALIGIMAGINLFVTVFAQIPFVLTKIYILASIVESQKTSFCYFICSFSYVGRLFALYSIVCVFGITTERYIAVFHPLYYRTHKIALQISKLCACIIVIQTIHVAFHIAFHWYNQITKFIGITQIPAMLIFVIVVHTKIHNKLKELAKSTSKQNKKSLARQKRYTSTSILVVSVFLVCFLPIAVVQFIDSKFGRKGEGCLGVYVIPWFIALSLTSSAINPIVYGFRDSRLGRHMRDHLKLILNILRRNNRVPVNDDPPEGL